MYIQIAYSVTVYYYVYTCRYKTKKIKRKYAMSVWEK